MIYMQTWKASMAPLIVAVFLFPLACSPVRVIPLTAERFECTQEVDQLQHKPTRAHIEIARLRIKANLPGGMDALARESRKLGAHAFYIEDAAVQLAIGSLGATTGGDLFLSPGTETWAVAVRFLPQKR